MSHSDRLNIAVFIDFDNIEIGVRTTLNEHFDVGTTLDAIKERGEVVTKIAYADWTRAGEYSRHLTQHAIRLVQRNLTPGGDKNGADINLALDALEMAFTHPHINAYVIVGGDSDFLSLVEKLKQYDKKVFVVGGRQFTSIILQRNCHEFIAYENLTRKPAAAAKGTRPVAPAAATPVSQAFPIIRRALKILSDREVSPQTGLLKSTLLQLDSTFSERNYGASSFLDFTEKLSQAGLVQLKHSGRSVMVELNPGFEDTENPDARPRPVTIEEAPASAAAPAPEHQTGDREPTEFPQAEAMTPAPPVTVIGDQSEGIQLAGQILGAATGARWPMYLRNAKQILRAGAFDERRYGFAGLIDLLRGCMRENFVRLERDRRGGLRVFQGSALATQPRPVAVPSVVDGNRADDSPVVVDVHEQPIIDVDGDLDAADVQPAAVVDTTAELLGRAKARRPRVRPVAAAPAPVARRKPAAKKAAGARKPARTRKPIDDDAGNR